MTTHTGSFLLGAEDAMQAVTLVKAAVDAAMTAGFMKTTLHVVIMNPGIKPWEVDDAADAILYQETLGDNTNPKVDLYRRIARAKAIETWRETATTHEITSFMPYKLRTGDTPEDDDTIYWGSAHLYGIAVAASGAMSCDDEMVATMVAAALRSIAHKKMLDLSSRDRAFLRQ